MADPQNDDYGTDKYPKEVIDAMLKELQEGATLTSVCKKEEYPSRSQVYLWNRENDAFHRTFTRTRQNQADTWVDMCVDMVLECPAKNADIQKVRLFVDTIKWVACKYHPKVFGDQANPPPIDTNPMDKLVKTIDEARNGKKK